jgi:hypothetical protein
MVLVGVWVNEIVIVGDFDRLVALRGVVLCGNVDLDRLVALLGVVLCGKVDRDRLVALLGVVLCGKVDLDRLVGLFGGVVGGRTDLAWVVGVFAGATVGGLTTGLGVRRGDGFGENATPWHADSSVTLTVVSVQALLQLNVPPPFGGVFPDMAVPDADRKQLSDPIPSTSFQAPPSMN